MSSLDFIEIFQEDGKEGFLSMLKDDYEIKRMDSGKVTKIIQELSELKSQDCFEILPIDPTPSNSTSSSSSLSTLTEINGFQFESPLEDLISPDSSKLITDAHHTFINKRVKVKISGDLSALQSDHDNLLHIRDHFQNSPQDQNSFVEVYGDVMEGMITHPTSGEPLHVMALERGEENMERYLFNHPRLISQMKEVLAVNLCEIVDLVHQSGLVWLDVKPSNIVHFPSSTPEWKGIDFEFSLLDQSPISSNYACTPLYAPPELVRHSSSSLVAFLALLFIFAN